VSANNDDEVTQAAVAGVTEAVYTSQLRVPVVFNIVWSVLYEHREYNHSRLFLNLLISRRPTFRPSASWPQQWVVGCSVKCLLGGMTGDVQRSVFTPVVLVGL